MLRNLLKNKKLLLILLVFPLYFIVAPFYPRVEYWFYKMKGLSLDNVVDENGSDIITEEVDLSSDETYSNKTNDTFDNIKENRLVISDINVDINIVEGYSDEVLSLGAWRRPNGGTPDKGGNTVITAHRFQYLPPNNRTFYNLDKVEEGDRLIVFWEGVRYVYKVTEVFVVEPDDVEIEAGLDGNFLTLYTCTPIWTASKRLVVRGELVN